MLAPTASGQRCIGAGPFYWMADIARVLRERVPQAAKRIPKRSLPDWLVRLSAVSAGKARAELGWTPRPNDDAIIATAESLLAQGLVRA